MHDNELWQEYNQNGTPRGANGYSTEEFRRRPNSVMGNSHIWFWKRNNSGNIEILLQKRSMTKRDKPGMYNLSAGGHINIGETPVEAAKRETLEEMGIYLDIEKLYYISSLRRVKINPNSLVNVYLYQLDGTEEFSFDDGEVDSVKWISIDNFKKITSSPDEHNLVDMGEAYFSLLIDSLEYVAGE